MVKLLIEHGAVVGLADNDGVTPLQLARKRGSKEIEQLLVNAGEVAERSSTWNERAT